jgi:hypothetical protein
MAKFDAAIDRHRFLKKETQEKAWTAFVSNDGQPLPHGLGWFVTDYSGARLIWHYGHWGTGFSAIYLKVPEKRISLVVLANSEALADHQFKGNHDITNNAVACSFLRLFVFDQSRGQGDDCERSAQTAVAKWLEDRRDSARRVVRVDPDILQAYVGRYQYEEPPNRIFTVRREGDRLFADIPKDFTSELFAESESTFFFKTTPRQMTFIKDGGRVTRIDFVVEGEVWRAKRL